MPVSVGITGARLANGSLTCPAALALRAHFPPPAGAVATKQTQLLPRPNDTTAARSPTQNSPRAAGVSSKSYDRWTYTPEKRAAMEKWNEFVTILLAVPAAALSASTHSDQWSPT
ncbi:MAG: hypothetical protein ACRD2O_09000 [Terriglobia bacterium]